MTIDKNLKSGILSSLIGTLIFLILLKPLGNFLWNLVKLISAKWYYGFSNSIYSNAALGHRNWIDVYLIILGSTIIMGIYFLGLRLLKDKIEEISIREAKSDQEKKKLLLNREKSLRRIRWRIKYLSKPIYYFSYVYFFLFLVANLNLMFKTYTDLQLNTSFNQRLDVLAPYIESKDYSMLKSKWALMKSREDYELIISETDELALKNNIKLPELLLK
jgi:hypothetical protein